MHKKWFIVLCMYVMYYLAVFNGIQYMYVYECVCVNQK